MKTIISSIFLFMLVFFTSHAYAGEVILYKDNTLVHVSINHHRSDRVRDVLQRAGWMQTHRNKNSSVACDVLESPLNQNLLSVACSATDNAYGNPVVVRKNNITYENLALTIRQQSQDNLFTKKHDNRRHEDRWHDNRNHEDRFVRNQPRNFNSFEFSFRN